MKNLFSFKKMSRKIAFIVVLAVIIVAGAATAYMETRIIEEVDRYSRMYLRYQLKLAEEECDIALVQGSQIGHVEDLVARVRVYDTGFALIENERGGFAETNSIISSLGESEKNRLADTARANYNEAFDIKLGGVNYIVAHTQLIDGTSLYLLAPKNEAMADVNASLVRFVVIFVTVLGLVMVVSYFIGKSIGAPLVVFAEFMKKAGTTGDIILSKEDMAALEKLSQIRDETGQCIGATLSLIEHITNIAKKLETVSTGDLTVNVELLSQKDVMGKSLQRLVDNLNNMFGEINDSTNQVSAGSREIAHGAQLLAQGSTEQSASIEELLSSITEIAERTKANAATADKTSKLSVTIKENAEKGSRQMDDMIKAVSDINEASKSISKIIKTIDDIAFQTNILALNATVEAARAGQHGKGFAVVAEEVRNLASKSAGAAKDTGNIIQNSMEKAEFGARIAGETAASLSDIVVGINESSGLIAEIASASEQQSLGISQINTGIDQVAQVVHQISATAEESAAASEEMSGNSDVLLQHITQFKLRERGMMRSLPPAY